MTSINKIKIGNTAYDIKDTTEKYLPLSAGIDKKLTDNLYIKDDNLDIENLPSSWTNYSGYNLVDKDNHKIGFFNSAASESWGIGAYFGSMSTENHKTNGLTLGFDSNEDRQVIVSEAKPWRTALNVPGLSGNNVYSSSNDNNAWQIYKSNNLDITQNPSSSSSWGKCKIVYQDKNATNMFQIAPAYGYNNGTGSVGGALSSEFQIETQRYHNNLYIGVGKDGTAKIDVSAGLNGADGGDVATNRQKAQKAWQVGLGLNIHYWKPINVADFIKLEHGWAESNPQIYYNEALKKVKAYLELRYLERDTLTPSEPILLGQVAVPYRPLWLPAILSSITYRAYNGYITSSDGKLKINIGPAGTINQNDKIFLMGEYSIGE